MKNWLINLLVCISVCTSAHGETLTHEEEYRYMDGLALAAGADKASSFHNYTEVYSRYLAELKDKPLTFLEIGIYKGASVKFWESYFTQAQLHFIDIDFSRIQYHSTRSHYHCLDQSNMLGLKVFGTTIGGFDVVIDDGGHTMDQQINSFKALFPFVRKGGLYIIEDLHTSYWKSFGGKGTFENPKAGPGTAVEFFKNLVEEVNFGGARTKCADFNKIPPEIRKSLNEYQANIYSIHFYDSVCIIQKR